MDEMMHVMNQGFIVSVGIGIVLDLLMYGVSKAFHLVRINK